MQSEMPALKRVEEVRRAIDHDIRTASACSDDQAYAATLNRLAETVPEIPPQLLARFDTAWSTDGFDASLRWSVVLRDAGSTSVAASATDLIERFLKGLETALRADQMEAARAVMRKRHNVLRKLAK